MTSLIGTAAPWEGGATLPGMHGAAPRTRDAPEEDGSMAARDNSTGGGGVGVGEAGVIEAGAGTTTVVAAVGASTAVAGAPPSGSARGLAAPTAGAAHAIGAGAGTGTRVEAGVGVKRGPQVPIRRVRTTTKAPAARAARALADPREAARPASALWGRSDGGGGGGASSDDEVEEVRAPTGGPFLGSGPGRRAAARAARVGGDGSGYGGNKKRRAADALAWSGSDDDDDDDSSPPLVGKGKGAAPGNRISLATSAAAAPCGPPYSGKAGGGVGFTNGFSGGGMSGKAGSGFVRGRAGWVGESCGQQRRLQPPTGRSRLASPAAAARSPSGGGRSGRSASSSACRGEGGGAGAGSELGSGSSGVFGKPEGRPNNGRNAGVGVVEIDLTVRTYE